MNTIYYRIKSATLFCVSGVCNARAHHDTYLPGAVAELAAAEDLCALHIHTHQRLLHGQDGLPD